MIGLLFIEGLSMKVKNLFVLTLALLLVAACGPEMATPTPRPDTGTAEAAATVEVEATETPDAGQAGDTATPGAGEVLTPTEPISPTGGVEVALAAIEPVEGPLATVNGEEITWEDFEPELKQALHSVTLQYGVDWNQAENIGLLATFQDEILQTVIDRTLLRQSAADEGIEASQDAIDERVEEQKTAVLGSGMFGSWEQFLEQYGLTEEYFARLMEDAVLIDEVAQARAPSREAEQVHARHILVADEEAGQEVLDRLEAGEEWGALASELSQDTTNKDNEGDLGWFPRGVMVDEFEEVAFSMEPGTTSDLVQTDFGYHIIQVLEKGVRETDDQTYESVKSQAFQTWFEEQKAAAETTIDVTFGTAQ
jgi:parvulin-like peptidyl-prolyl isomerase